jgi:YVTN family beta-propeller protein
MKLSRRLPALLFISFCIIITLGFVSSTAEDTDIPIEGDLRSLAINPDTDQALVGSVKPNEISVVTLDTEQVIATIGVGKKPLGVAVDSTLNLALVVQKPSHTLSIISLDTHQVLANISVGKSTCNVAVYERDSGPHLGLTAIIRIIRFRWWT